LARQRGVTGQTPVLKRPSVKYAGGDADMRCAPLF